MRKRRLLKAFAPMPCDLYAKKTLKLDTECETMVKSRVRTSGIFKNMKGSDGAVNVSDTVLIHLKENSFYKRASICYCYAPVFE